MQTHTTSRWVLGGLLTGALALSGCAHHHPSNAQLGTGVGAVAGGALGNALFGTTIGTVGGAAAGALIGNQMGSNADRGGYYRHGPRRHHR